MDELYISLSWGYIRVIGERINVKIKALFFMYVSNTFLFIMKVYLISDKELKMYDFRHETLLQYFTSKYKLVMFVIQYLRIAGCESLFTHANRHCQDHPYATLKRVNPQITINSLQKLLLGEANHAVRDWLTR